MKNCVKCNKSFPNLLKIDNKIRNLCKRKYCLECSPFGMKNTRQLHKDSLTTTTIDGVITPIPLVCEECNKPYFYRRDKGNTYQKCSTCLVNNRRFGLKIKSLEYKGGKC